MNSSPPSSKREMDSGSAKPDFMALFCERYRCPPSEFEEQAFLICLYWRARIVAPLIRKIRPDYFDRDFALIRYLGKTPGRRDAMNELAAFMEANKARGGFARKFLRIRISSRKTSELVGRLFERHAERDDPSADRRTPN